MWRWLTAMAVIVATTAAAAGQTTRPAPVAVWNRTVNDFAAAVVAGDEDAARSVLGRGALISAFVSRENGQLTRLIDLAAAHLRFSTHAYVYPPVTLAADLSADAAVSDLPPEVKRALAVDAANAAPASDTAVKWVGTTLAADDGSMVGMIALWKDNGSAAVRPMFILVKGAMEAGDKMVIVKVVYGDPIP